MKLRVGILGAGAIARTMADTLARMGKAEAYAVASRELEKAQLFAKMHEVKEAYGSYQEMLRDEKVDLVYIATPHTLHYEHAKMCIDFGKPVLVEKPFCVNAKEAETLLSYAREKEVFIAEAIWTRYMPMRDKINEELASGSIGEPKLLTANLGYSMTHKERLVKPELAGGALLDVGIYPLNFAAMVFGHNIKEIHAFATFTETGVDANDSITIIYEDGKMAVLNSSMLAISDREGIIQGSKGYMIVDNINNPQSYTIYDGNHKEVKKVKGEKQISGYEYEIDACQRALNARKLSCEEMPHEEILWMMKQMDLIRKQCKISYPFEK